MHPDHDMFKAVSSVKGVRLCLVFCRKTAPQPEEKLRLCIIICFFHAFYISGNYDSLKIYPALSETAVKNFNYTHGSLRAGWLLYFYKSVVKRPFCVLQCPSMATVRKL